jgi:transcriptional regulator, tetR family
MATTKELILSCARELFLEHGYEGVSMRMIATRCNISLGLTYHYFVGKEALFSDIIRPVVQTLDYIFMQHNSPEHCNEAIFEDIELGQYREFLLLVTKYRRELRLLLLYAKGSPYEGYEQEFIKQNNVLGRAYLSMLKEKYPTMRTNLSDRILQITVENWLHVLKSLLSEELTDADRAQILREYFTFTTGGWKRLIADPSIEKEEAEE